MSTPQTDARSAVTAPPEVLEAITTAATTAFEELAQTPLIPGRPFFTRTNPAADHVTAEITLRRAAPGKLRIVFPRPALETLAGRYLPAGILITPELLDDTAGEFANVISGQSKTMLHGTPYHFSLSTPRIGPPADAGDGTEYLVLPFAFDAGAFEVCVQLSACAEEASA